MRPKDIKDARMTVRVLPGAIRRGSNAIADNVGRAERGEQIYVPSGRLARTMSVRIVELAEAKVMLSNQRKQEISGLAEVLREVARGAAQSQAS